MPHDDYCVLELWAGVDPHTVSFPYCKKAAFNEINLPFNDVLQGLKKIFFFLY